MAVVVVAAVFGLVLPRIASYGDVVDVVGAVSALHLAALLAAAALNVATFAPPWMTALPGLGFRRAIVVTQVATAVSSVVPAGEAVGVGVFARVLRGWGFARGAVAAAVAVVATFNVLVKVVFPVAAIAWLLAAGKTASRPLQVGTAAAVGLAVLLLAAFAVAVRRESSAHALGAALERIVGRVRRIRGQSIAERLAHFRASTLELLGRRWASLAAWTLVGHLCVFVVLVAALRAARVDDIALVDAFAAWAFTRLLTAVPITPGGLGIVELGLTGGLVAAGGDDTRVVAAVLLYRAFTWLPTLAVGAITAPLARVRR